MPFVSYKKNRLPEEPPRSQNPRGRTRRSSQTRDGLAEHRLVEHSGLLNDRICTATDLVPHGSVCAIVQKRILQKTYENHFYKNA